MNARTTGAAWSLREQVSLRALNSFGIEAFAPRLLEIADPAVLPELLTQAPLADAPLLVLGGGSNVLLVADPEGIVLTFVNRNVEVIAHHADHAIVRAGAGVCWHELVMWSLHEGLSGLENLALIPGSVGAAPIQNIGAYGTQVGEFVHAVDAFDRVSGEAVRLEAAACAFAYRDSVFKHQPDRFLITAVELNLPLLHELRLDYAGIRDELAGLSVELPEAADVAQAVINLRRRKLPDPVVLGNAGSFFKNPQLPREQADLLQRQYPTMPLHLGEHDADAKLSAAWLIEQCGWKGYRHGDAGVSAEHALVLVNHGNASGIELLTLARRIAASVHERFAVRLEPEPRLIGAQW